MYWNITNMLKFLKFKSDFVHSKFVLWISSWCTYLDYASKFNGPYSIFHLSKCWKRNYILNFVFLYILILKDDKSYMWEGCFMFNVVGRWERPWNISNRSKDQNLILACWCVTMLAMVNFGVCWLVICIMNVYINTVYK
jgi:hypothetical protein